MPFGIIIIIFTILIGVSLVKNARNPPKEIQFDELPEPIQNIASSCLDTNNEPPQFVRAFYAKFSDQDGYSIILKKSSYNHEFEITSDGRLLEFEKEQCS